jgi:phage tail sheath protein FI
MPSSAYRTPGVYVEWLDSNAQQLEIGRTDVAGFVGLAERGPVQAPTKIESAQQFWTTFGDPIPGAYLAQAVEGFFANGGRACWIVRAADPDHAVAAWRRVPVVGREPLTLQAGSPGTWGNAIAVAPVWGRDRVEALAVTAPGRATQRIDLSELDAAPTRENLLGVPDDFLPEVAPEVLVNVVAPDAVPGGAVAADAGASALGLGGGDDGVASLTVDHLAGDPGGVHAWGVAALERVPGISIVAVPDLLIGRPAAPARAGPAAFADADVHDAQLRIVASCARCRDRVAILDLPPGDRRQALAWLAWRDQASPAIAWSYAAAYHPWLVVNDPARDAVRAMPPSCHVAGVYARVDRLRGVHKPPANEPVEAAWDLTEALDDDGHADLNDAGVNAIRAVPGRGVRVLGARTLHPDVRWRYVNVRRLFAMIEDALETQLQWLTFEPNDPRLWREIDRALRGFLQRLFRAGMLDGATEDDAFFVRCDGTTNPAPEVDAGRATCLVGLQPPYPAEFVVVRIGLTRNGIEVEEKGAQDA